MLSFFRGTRGTATLPPKQGYVRLEHGNKEHTDVLVVNWCLGNLCNYACTYCPEDLHNGSTPWVTLEVIKNFVDRVQNHYGKERKYFLELTGGEVTLFKDFIPLMEFLKERGWLVGIISNGSRAMPFWERVRPYLNQICLSFHPQGAKPDHYLDVARYLSETVRVHLNFMMDPDHFYLSYETAARGKEIANVSIALQPLILDFGTQLYEYTKTQNKILEKQHDLINGHVYFDKFFPIYRGAMEAVTTEGKRTLRDPQQLISSGENSWAGWKCNAGLEQMVVNMGGDVFRGWCLEGGKIGHVADKDLKFPSVPVLCTKNFCHCNFDIMTTKALI